ncbi:major capsid protein [Tortoise microvirus 46]|nr:major capsid protein [Tortoise microvirus 46]
MNGKSTGSMMELANTSAMPVEWTTRTDQWRGITSFDAGKVVPLAYAPLLREDNIQRGSFRVSIEMAETARVLLNAVNVTLYAHFVPYLAFERFQDLGSLNRAYQGVPEKGAANPVPFHTWMDYTRTSQIMRTLGIHAPEGDKINSALIEAYNCLINHRRRTRSTKLAERSQYNDSLAEAFWKNPEVYNIVPDFDAAKLDGEVDLVLGAARLPVSGIALKKDRVNAPITYKGVQQTGARTGDMTGRAVGDGYQDNNLIIQEDLNNKGFPAIFAELANKKVRLSLANIDSARQTAAFAEIRKKYNWIDEDYIIDLLMSGIRVPELEQGTPVLLARESSVIGIQKQNATDGASLGKYVASGVTELTVNFRMPATNTGGVVLLTCEVVPDQLFERQRDQWLDFVSTDRYPEYLRDYLDPQKVEYVRNADIDNNHSNRAGIFGYRPLNEQWNRNAPHVGGKFFRPLPDKNGKEPWNEERQRIWSVTRKDPTLTEDWYLVKDLPKTVFKDANSHAFTATTVGALTIVGMTQFGQPLDENNDDFDRIAERVDYGRIDPR